MTSEPGYQSLCAPRLDRKVSDGLEARDGRTDDKCFGFFKIAMFERRFFLLVDV